MATTESQTGFFHGGGVRRHLGRGGCVWSHGVPLQRRLLLSVLVSAGIPARKADSEMMREEREAAQHAYSCQRSYPSGVRAAATADSLLDESGGSRLLPGIKPRWSGLQTDALDAEWPVEHI
jgi:hypothetical protein